VTIVVAQNNMLNSIKISEYRAISNRYAVTAVFHGHAHEGSLKGYTTGGTAVYNVAAPLLQKVFPDRPPFHIVDIQESLM
jgi:hypothetical protein